jgi:hypothetical protein
LLFQDSSFALIHPSQLSFKGIHWFFTRLHWNKKVHIQTESR